MERIVSNPWDCLDNGALREDTSIRLHKGGRESTRTSLDGLILDQVLEALSDYADDLMHCQGRIVPSDSVAGMMKHESKLTKSDGPVRSCLPAQASSETTNALPIVSGVFPACRYGMIERNFGFPTKCGSGNVPVPFWEGGLGQG